MLKIDRNSATNDNGLLINKDETEYTRDEIHDLLVMIENGNKATGGLEKTVANAYGILGKTDFFFVSFFLYKRSVRTFSMPRYTYRSNYNLLILSLQSLLSLLEYSYFIFCAGFVKFLQGYYMILVTAKHPVALIDGHYIYAIDATTTLAINTHHPVNPEEQRYLSIFCQVDMSKGFYFSHNYDITRHLQKNVASTLHKEGDNDNGDNLPEDDATSRKQRPSRSNHLTVKRGEYNDMFAWNHALLLPLIQHVGYDPAWILPCIHGFVDQASKQYIYFTPFVLLI